MSLANRSFLVAPFMPGTIRSLAMIVLTANGAAAQARAGGSTTMDLKIPASLKVEHEELHAELSALTRAPGKTGEAARNVATALHAHFA